MCQTHMQPTSCLFELFTSNQSSPVFIIVHHKIHRHQNSKYCLISNLVIISNDFFYTIRLGCVFCRLSKRLELDLIRA